MVYSGSWGVTEFVDKQEIMLTSSVFHDWCRDRIGFKYECTDDGGSHDGKKAASIHSGHLIFYSYYHRLLPAKCSMPKNRDKENKQREQYRCRVMPESEPTKMFNKAYAEPDGDELDLLLE